MSDLTQKGFNITEAGFWPEEMYYFYPDTSKINPSLGNLQYVRDFRYITNPVLNIENVENYIESFNLINSFNLNLLSNVVDYKSANSRFVLNASAAKVDGYENYVNYFKLNLGTSKQTQFYAYLFYPKKPYLRPISVVKNNDNSYQLNLSVVLLSSTLIPFFNENPDRLDVAPKAHLDYILGNYADIIPLPKSINNRCTLSFDLSSTQTIIKRPIIEYENDYNPREYSILLENNNFYKKIRQDFTFVEFDVRFFSFYGNLTLENLGTNYYDDPNGVPYFTDPISFNSRLSTRQPNPNKNFQTFLLVQSGVNLAVQMQHPSNSVLSATLDLESTNFRYFAKADYSFQRNTFVNLVTGQAGTNLTLSYIVDSHNLKHTTERAADTVINFQNQGSGSLKMSEGILSDSTNSHLVSFTTKYPPHYYSYNLHVNKENLSETSNLTFTLSTYSITDLLTSVRTQTFLHTNYNTLKLDLATYGVKDKIKYVQEYNDLNLLNSISAYIVTPTGRTYYNLNNPNWLNAHESQFLEITYPTDYVGLPTVTIRPILSTLGGELHAIFASVIPLKGIDEPFTENPYLVDIEILDEGDDYIDLSVATLTSTEFYPGLDLRNTRIQWSVSTSNDPNVKINYLLKGDDDIYKPINFITNETNLLFDTTSWAIRVSGYGPITTYITLSSQLMNSRSSVETNSAFFNFFADEKLIVGPLVELDNFNEIRTITLTANIPYKGRQYNLPTNTLLYWEWEYDDILNPSNIPLSSKYILNNTEYNYGDSNVSQEISGLRFFINPDKSLTTPIAHDIKISVYTSDTESPYTATYEFDIDDFPDKQIFNADFDVRYSNFPTDVILNTRNNEFVLTREDNGTTLYDLKANTDVVPFINASDYKWEILKSTNPSISTVYGLTSIKLNTSGVYKTDVTFTVLCAYPEGWTFPHNVFQKITIYTVPTLEFNKPPSFILYPQFAWLNSPRLTILDQTNFRSFAASTTAYGYKTSNSEIYNISASPNFDQLLFGYGEDRNFVDEINSSIGQINIPYTSEFFSNTGITVHLTAYNDLYPKNTPLLYKTIVGGNLITKSHNITAKSIPYNISTPDNLKYFQNPKLIDYNSISYTFSATITSYDLDVNRTISVNQKVFNNPLNSPATVQTNNSTITYVLSTENWTVTRNVPPIDGIYPIFTLNVGDAANSLTVNGTNLNSLYLNASAKLNIKIPPDTFENYTFPEYTGIRDLWSEKTILLNSNLVQDWQTIVAFSTAAQPEIFLNTYYAITANSVFVEFKTPELKNNPIVSYSVNFGETANDIIESYDKTFYYQYSSTGTFYVTYSAIYQDGSYKNFISVDPFIIKENWPEYNQESLRIINETTLTFPYTLDQILIQPNEFGDSDIFNNSIQRTWECLEYLKGNIKTMNIDSPIAYYGWLGTTSENRASGIRWYTSSYGSQYLNEVTTAISNGTSFFSNIKDIDITKNYIFVLDENKFRVFENDKNAKEIKFSNIDELNSIVFDPKSIAVTEDENSIYVLDSIKNRTYRFDFDFSQPLNPIFSLVLTLGSFGSLNETNKFDFPSEIKYKNDSLYILDFNNKCVKQFNRDLSWMHTYYDNSFEEDQLLNIAVHPNQMLYIIGKSLNIYVFDLFGETIYKVFKLQGIQPDEIITKIFFSEVGEFLYVVTKNSILKYTATGEYITTVVMPETNLDFVSGQISEYRSLNFTTKNSIIRVQDFVEIFEIGDGLESNYWSLEQMLLNKDEFAQDLNYNFAFQKINQNLKTFRNSLNSKFVFVTEQTSRGTISYFSLVPISTEDKPIFEEDIENENLHIGVNEFHIPPVINRELEKLYNALITLKTNLDISNVNSIIVNDSSECGENFCWSWKSMSCYNLSLPIIRICNINPITYAELVDSFPVPYAPTKKWGQATSECCSEFVSPLDK
jgi:hypothetical protein